jgi:hypothetical protein
MSGFFAQYAAMGLVIFLAYLAISLGIGLFLGNIFKKKWIFLVILILNAIVFYFSEIITSFIFILVLACVSVIIYLIKKFTKNETE